VLARAAPFSPVALAIGFNLFVLRAEVSPAASPNDMGAHISMVHYVAQRISQGKLPFDGWYPRLAMGVALFHHYQSLAPILAGLLATHLGAARTVAWSNYLLLSLWPLCVYWTARLFGLNRWTAATTALLSPLVSSVTLYGYEHGSFTWIGNGVWSELWAMWLLPLTLAFSWRAIARGKGYAPAALFLGLTVACHFLTAYLAVLALAIWVLIAPKEILRRSARAAIVGIGGALVGSWVLVPVFKDANFSARTQYNTGLFWSNSYGAKKVMSWLFTGELFDHGRWPVLSILVAVGTLVCLWRFGRDERARGVLAFTAVSLVLFCGRGPFGFVINRLPGGPDLLLHRFIIGVHLGGIALAGIGAGVLVQLAYAFLHRRLPRVPPAAFVAALLVVGLVALAPAWRERAHFDALDANNINSQQVQDATDGHNFTTLADQAAALGGGRVFAGSSAANGQAVAVGQVPGYVYLLDDDVDAIGFSLRTLSISADVEVSFNPADAAQYNLFNIHYVIVPEGTKPLVRATFLSAAGRWQLWTVDTTGYLQVVDTTTTITADRTNIGRQTSAYLQSSMPALGVTPTIAFAGSPAATPTAPNGKPAGSPGDVSVQYALPDDGQFGGVVTANREAVVMLKATYDPNWKVTVDGKPAKTQMLAPSFVGVEVPPGRHRIDFRYQNYPYYWLLFAVGALTLVALAVVPRLHRNRRFRKSAPAATTR
jgi:xanthosine utilization system XapX-like protein